MRIVFASALLILVGCNNADKKEAVNVSGAWKMLSQHVKQGTTDSTYTNIPQLKIFTGDHMMYANVNPGDSSGSFGVGSYTANADTITEHVFFSDSLNKNHTGIGFGTFAMNGNNKAKENMVSSTYSQVTGQSFDLDISTNGADEFTQTIVDKDGTKGIETYHRIK